VPRRFLWTLRSRPWGFAVVLAVALFVANVIARPSFAAWGSWPGTLIDFAPFALAAMAQTPAILAGGGGIDISIGPLLNFVSVVLVGTFISHGTTSIFLCVPACLLVGMIVGAANGLMVSSFRLPAILATLCMNFVLTGLGVAVLAEPATGTTRWLSSLGDQVGPIPGGLILIAVPVRIWWGLGRSTFLDALYSVGDDEVTAFSAGVDINRVRLLAYTLGGLFAGFAGIALAAATQTGDSSQASEYSLTAIVAVVVGGTSLLGGRGSLTGSIAGAGIIFMVQTLMDSLQISANAPQMIFGAILILAIVINSRLGRPVTSLGLATEEAA
jgi:ribose transport system permease protein